MNANFDTLDINRTLKAGGLDEPAADAITEAINKAIHASVATRADLDNAETRIMGRVDATRADLENTEARLAGRMDGLDGRMAALDAKLTGRMDSLDGRMAALDAKLTGRMDKLEGELGGRMTGIEGRMKGIDGQLRIMTWSMGFGFAIMFAVLGWIASAVH